MAVPLKITILLFLTIKETNFSYSMYLTLVLKKLLFKYQVSTKFLKKLQMC